MVEKQPGATGGYFVKVIDGRQVLFDEEGFLVHPESWTETAAEAMALEMGIQELSGPQREMLQFLRRFYLANGRAPLNRDIKRETGVSLIELEQLFPEGIRRGARRLAGLPNPKAC